MVQIRVKDEKKIGARENGRLVLEIGSVIIAQTEWEKGVDDMTGSTERNSPGF